MLNKLKWQRNISAEVRPSTNPQLFLRESTVHIAQIGILVSFLSLVALSV